MTTTISSQHSTQKRLHVVYPSAHRVDGAQGDNLVQIYSDWVLHTVVPRGTFPIDSEMTPQIADVFQNKPYHQQTRRVNASQLIGTTSDSARTPY